MRFLLIELLILAVATTIIILAVTSALHVAVVIALVIVGAGLALYGTFMNIIGNAAAWVMKNS